MEVSPFHLVRIYAGFVNGGMLPSPFLVRRIMDPDGNPVEFNKRPSLKKCFSPHVASLIYAYLKSVTSSEHGTGVKAAVEGYEIAGKTGTARRIVNGRYSRRTHNSAFIGILPLANDRPLVIGVFFQDVKKGSDYGGSACAPVFKKTFQDNASQKAFMRNFQKKPTGYLPLKAHSLQGLYQETNFQLLSPVLALCMFGVAAVFRAGLSPQFSSPFILLKSKLYFAGFGMMLVTGLSMVDYHIYENRRLQVGLSMGMIILLLFLFLFGPREFGANLRLKFFSKTFQPTEYAKILVVLVLSYTITETFRRRLLSYFVLSVHTALLVILFVLIALQPDYGAVLILLATALCMLIAARIQAQKSLFIVIFGAIVGGLLFVGMCLTFPRYLYVFNRIKSFLVCFFIKGCDTYQINSAYDTIISGGFFGDAITDAIHPHGVLPMECNDFIFCVIAEGFGFVGIFLLLAVYLFFIREGFLIARYCRDFFGQLMAFGLTCMIGLQALINMLVAIGLFPATGITLPFVSHGGNSILACMIAIGILLNISKNTIRP